MWRFGITDCLAEYDISPDVFLLRRMDGGIKSMGRYWVFPPRNVRTSGPPPRGRASWFPRGGGLTRVSCINSGAKDIMCLPVRDLVDPFLPKPHQIMTIADIELVAIIISVATWECPGKQ